MDTILVKRSCLITSKTLNKTENVSQIRLWLNLGLLFIQLDFWALKIMILLSKSNMQIIWPLYATSEMFLRLCLASPELKASMCGRGDRSNVFNLSLHFHQESCDEYRHCGVVCISLIWLLVTKIAS